MLTFLQKSSNPFPFMCLLCSAWSAQIHTGGCGWYQKILMKSVIRSLQQNKSEKFYFISSQYNHTELWFPKEQLVTISLPNTFFNTLFLQNWKANVNKKQQYCSCCYCCHCLFPQCHWTFKIQLVLKPRDMRLL
jgi:hypothetical protein